ncbi:MAG: AmmeMemoRadiSam system protein B [Candidatus Alcyoniella australis]|nr:AmmeMemoRadiSam system protein B [Candidatus Alcyoniella australis]
MADPSDSPKLRELEFVPAEVQGQPVVALRDPLALSEQTISIPYESLGLLQMLDGNNSIRDIQTMLTKASGEIVPSEPLVEFIDVLDSQFLLDNQHFQKRMVEVSQVYLDSPLREAVCIGSYPDQPEHCTRLFERYASIEAGPGPIDFSVARPAPENIVHGIIAPHIDYQRGGASYAFAYKALAEGSDATTYVVFGTDHHGLAEPYSLTDKSFTTPYGPLEVDRELYQAVGEALHGDFGEPLAHRQEHSIELAAIWLAYIGDRLGRKIRILPVLLGSFGEHVESEQPPDSDPRLAALLQAIRQSTASRGNDVAFVASADLAHIGQQFGDRHKLNEKVLKASSEADQLLLHAALEGSAEGFFESVVAEHDSRRICGLAPIYAALACMPRSRGELLQYGQWSDDGGLASVSFASISFRPA